MKVLYIAGSGRSGSTILDNILGQLDGFASVGEVRFLWERGVLEDRTCGCGQPFSSCPFWQAVLDRAFGGPGGVGPHRMMTLLARGTRARHVPRLVGGAARRRRFVAGLDELPAALRALYEAIAAESGAEVIVDSSKLPTYGAVLGEVPGVEVSTLHLVRDPRAAGYSWLRRKPLPDRPGAVMQRQGPLHSAALWTLWNATAEVLGRGPSPYRRLRYEDLIAAPEAEVRAIAAWMDREMTPTPFEAPDRVRLAAAHGVAGNPSRFTTGTVTLREDDAWRTELRPADRRRITAVTWPLLVRHGYVG